MGSRNLLTVLVVIFVAVLAYNLLYFTGVVGNFGGSPTIEPLPDDPRMQLPGLNREGNAPQASAPRGSASSATSAVGRRAYVEPADLAMTSDWGRNPFFTPREIWALANYRPVYINEPSIAPGDLVLSAIVMDSTGRRVAVINGDVVSVGDAVAGMEVVDMWDDAVVFRLDGRRHVVRIADASINLTVSPSVPGRY